MTEHFTADRFTGADIARDEWIANISAVLKQVPTGDMAYVADATLTNEEFYQLKTLSRLAAGGRVFAPISNPVVEVWKQIKSNALAGEFPKNLETAKKVIVVGERLESNHPVLVLRLRRLFHTLKLSIVTIGAEDIGFEDIREKHFPLDKGLPKWTDFAGDGAVHVLLSDQAISSSNLSSLKTWLKNGHERGNVSVSLLLSGANSAGMLDQWDDSVVSIDELETEIQRGKVQGLFWFGKAPTNAIFDEYAKGMRLFLQFVERKSDVHSKVQWVLPKDSFFEKKGTYTNTFGRIQPIRRAKRVIEKGMEPASILSLFTEKLGQATVPVEQMYEELARSVSHYPKTLDEIPESLKTYSHYERALWR